MVIPRHAAAFGAVAPHPSCTLCGARAGAVAFGWLCPLEAGQSQASGSATGGKPQWFLALEGKAAARVRQDLALATHVATTPYSHNVAMYTPLLCLHLTNVISLASDLTCFPNTSSSPEPAVIRAVHPICGLGPGTRDFSEVPSRTGQGSLGQNLFSQERRTILQPFTSAYGDVPKDVSQAAESLQECLHWKTESLKNDQ